MKSRTVVMGLVLCLLFISSAYGANLAFRTIPLIASGDPNENVVDVGNDAGRVNFYTPRFDLNNLANEPGTGRTASALLVLMAKDVDDGYNFVTLNAEGRERDQINSAPYSSAKNSANYVGRLLQTGDRWSMQILRVPRGVLKPTGNTLGIHSRSSGGGTGGNTDDFSVTRAFLIYFGTGP